MILHRYTLEKWATRNGMHELKLLRSFTFPSINDDNDKNCDELSNGDTVMLYHKGTKYWASLSYTFQYMYLLSISRIMSYLNALYGYTFKDFNRWVPYTAQELYYVKHAYTTDYLLEDREFFGRMNSALTTNGVAYLKNVSCYCADYKLREVMVKYPEGYPPENAARKSEMIEIEYDFMIHCGDIYKFYIDPMEADRASIYAMLSRAAEEFRWFEAILINLDKETWKLYAQKVGVQHISIIVERVHNKADQWLQKFRGLRPGLAKSK